MDPRRSLPHALLRSYFGLRRSPFVSLRNRDLCLTHHCALGLRRFPFGTIAEPKLESQGKTKATDWRVVLREGLFVLAGHFCNDGKLNVSNRIKVPLDYWMLSISDRNMQ